MGIRFLLRNSAADVAVHAHTGTMEFMAIEELLNVDHTHRRDLSRSSMCLSGSGRCGEDSE